jgi:hypothetical protein
MQDAKQTQCIWELLQRKICMKQFIGGIFVWSDNAFKNKFNLNFFHKLATNDSIDVDCNYFASHYDHSICDRHFAHGKALLRSDHIRSIIESRHDVAESFQKLNNTNISIWKMSLNSPRDLRQS